MRLSLSLLLIATLALSACSSRLNPLNWFGRSQAAAVPADTNPLIPKRSGLVSRPKAVYGGTPVAEVTDLVIERVPGGALIRVTGRTARQGAYDVQLTPETEDETPVDGVLAYRLEAVQPQRRTVGAPHTREITAARQLTEQDLAGVRTIRVSGRLSARVSRR